MERDRIRSSFSPPRGILYGIPHQLGGRRRVDHVRPRAGGPFQPRDDYAVLRPVDPDEEEAVGNVLDRKKNDWPSTNAMSGGSGTKKWNHGTCWNPYKCLK